MLPAIVVISLFAFFCLLNFAPVIIQYASVKKAERDFESQINYLNESYEYYSVAITTPMGLGTSQNSDVKFEKAHRNQAQAVDSIISLINNMQSDVR